VLAPQVAILLSVLLFLFGAALVLYKFLGIISLSDGAGICAVATAGAIIWFVAVGLWWCVLAAAVCLVPITREWWSNRTPADHPAREDHQ
jgi:hypothetical protein